MLVEAEKCIIITERILVTRIIKYLETLGVSAYTIYHDVSGQGHRGLRSLSGGLSRFGENIRIEIIFEDEVKAHDVAHKIVEHYLSSKYAGIVYLEKVRIVK